MVDEFDNDEGEAEKQAEESLLVDELLESVQYTEDIHLMISSESLFGFIKLLWSSTIWDDPRSSPRLCLQDTSLVPSWKTHTHKQVSFAHYWFVTIVPKKNIDLLQILKV